MEVGGQELPSHVHSLHPSGTSSRFPSHRCPIHHSPAWPIRSIVKGMGSRGSCRATIATRILSPNSSTLSFFSINHRDPFLLSLFTIYFRDLYRRQDSVSWLLDQAELSQLVDFGSSSVILTVWHDVTKHRHILFRTQGPSVQTIHSASPCKPGTTSTETLRGKQEIHNQAMPNTIRAKWLS